MKALALLSGGLDSILAARLIMDQGIEVVGISFETPFFKADKGRAAARRLKIPFYSFDITDQFIDILTAPRYGYGKNLNPCVDCHRLMVELTYRQLKPLGADFIVSGEVIGQRPKSQNRGAMNAVSAGDHRGLLLRPLSARLMEETIPEKEGWVDRNRLLGISGRSRKEQFALAENYGIDEYSTPAGGCLLTEPLFCRRLTELRNREGWNRDDLELLRTGRHFRLSGGAKAVSGRNQDENRVLEETARRGDYLFQARGKPGSLILLRKKTKPTPEERTLTAGICARYSKEKKERLEIRVWKRGDPGEEEIISARPLSKADLDRLRI